VTGAHGKTTTSGMIAYALARLGSDPTYLVGGDVPQLGANAGAGDGDVCVAEGDESDRSVTRLPADVAVVLNVDLDHLDHYASIDEVVALLASWTARLPAAAVLVAGDGVELPTDAAVERFGLGPGEGLRALDAEAGPGGVSFAPSSGGRVALRVHGVHNAANACAAALALRALGVPLAEAFAVLATFTGTGRRFEVVGERDGVRVVDDYAHHPAELAATVAAGRAQRPARLVVYFQPHMPWRTRAFAAGFADALAAADVAVVGETYVARGAPEPGVTARAIVEHLHAAAPDVDAAFAADEEAAVEALRARIRRGDLVLCCGAGPVDRVARRLVAA
jgi:UDP-N-acetylmuramate--alanine ligase